ncbi:sugar transferase [Isachenkonia alkalipeptolytica]|uniref:Sugar transferase n=1 Tax=Isachenkonia alkalipeptolytica TaxID=2565777 RepID=A0AA44BF77_9CLOT|nr:sugar transferase [Isachenkonia alkalipeptolytica]NBG88890.1 sugar transferase [Isachenkonia alkalipeptolytica]
MRTVRLSIKRLLDIVLSLLGLIVLSPVFLITAGMIRKKMGSPVFFVQERPGKDGEIFKMIKFRTMLNTRDAQGNLLPNEQRHTRFGKMMRSTSLDELPELINVLKGEMSLVGPRPLLVEYLPRYNKHQARRHEVRPGITGWAQINGRNTISWEEKFDYDVWYVDNLRITLDIKILFLTVFKVFKRQDVNKSQQVTMEKFQGTDLDREKQ